MQRLILCLVVFCAWTTSLVAQPLADRVPGDAILYVGWRGANDPGAGYNSSRLKQIVDQSNISAVMNDFLPRAMKRIGMIDKDANEAMGYVNSFGSALWKYPSAFYFAGIDAKPGQQPMPRLGFICQAGAQAKEIQDKIEQLMAKAPEVPPGLEVIQQGDLVGITFGMKPDDLAKGTLAGSSEFTAAMKNAGGDPSLVFYADFQKAWSLVDDIVDFGNNAQAKEKWPKVRDALGLPNLRRMVMTSGFDGSDWVSDVFVELPSPRKGIFAALEGKPMSDEMLKQIPADSAMAFGGSIDLSALIDAIRTAAGEIDPEGAQNVDKVIGLASMYIGRNLQTEVLAPLGDHWVGYSSPSVAGRGLLGLVIVNKPDDAKKAESGFMSSMLALTNSINGAIPERRVQIRIEKLKSGEVGVNYIAIPLITPAWTFRNGYMYAGLYPQSVVSATKFSGSGIAENEQFAAMRKRIGATNLTGFTFVDLRTHSDDMYQGIVLLSRLGMGIGDLFGVKSPEMVIPTFDVLKPHMTYVGSISWTDDAGFHSREISPFPGAGLMGGDPAAFAALAGLQASVLLPAMAKARESATQVQCMSNQRQLAVALLMYSNDHQGKYPDSYEEFIEYAVKDMQIAQEIFVCPTQRDHMPQTFKAMSPKEFAEWAKDNSSYVYLGAGKTTNSGAEDILLYEKSGHHDRGGINIAYADGHVEFADSVRAQQELQRVGANDPMQPPPPPPAPRKKGGL
jgi:prepilin-type processing-associated H-X9-DG protein